MLDGSVSDDRGVVVGHMVVCLSHGSVPPEEATESAEKSGMVSPLIIFLNGGFPRKNALSIPRQIDAVSPPNADLWREEED